MRGKFLIVLIICLIGGLYACSDFWEEPLNGKKLSLIAPADSVKSSNYLQTFWWEKVRDANAYRLQIVQTTFDHPEELLLDTLVNDDKFTFTLAPGTYQWRVRAENSSSFGLYSVRNLIIYEASLTKQQVQIKSPANGVSFNTADFICSWYPLYGSTSYRVQIDSRDRNFADEGKLLANELVSRDVFSYKIDTDGKYIWRVSAVNDSTQSKWSMTRDFEYDKTPPEVVVLRSPVNAQMVSSPVSLSWVSQTEAKKYQVMVMNIDSTTYSTKYPFTVSSSSYSFTEGIVGKRLLWKVRAVDAAGNLGAYSMVRNFTVQ